MKKRKPRPYDAADAAQVLSENYAQVYRLAHVLCGRADAARQVVRYILKITPEAYTRWPSNEVAASWFNHHTLLTSRLSEGIELNVADDVLRHLDDAPEYLAFLVAIRSLPSQQREAFLLAYAGGLVGRDLSVAMDCSNTAAANHLNAATAALQKMTSGQFDSLVKHLKAQADWIEPEPGEAKQLAQQAAAEFGAGWRWWVVGSLLAVALLLAGGVAVWRWLT